MSLTVTTSLVFPLCSKAHSFFAASIRRRLLIQALLFPPGPFPPLLTKFGIAIKAKIPTTQAKTNISRKPKAGFDFFFVSLIQLNQHHPANSVSEIYLLRPPGAKW